MTFPIFFNASFDKNQLKHLIDWCLHTYGETFTLEFLEQMKYFGFHYATQAGVSLGIDDLKIPQQKAESISKAQCEKVLTEQSHVTGNLTSVEKSQRLIEVWNETSDYLRHSAVQSLRGMHSVNPVYMMAFSGARGNISQVRQLVAMRGLMADPLGAILEFPIQSNFREGLTFTEYFISCYGARKGLVDTALRTATAGYLTRRLVDAVQHVVVALFDCGTTKAIPVHGKNIHQRLIGRVLARPLELQFPDDPKLQYSRNHIVSPSDALHIARHYTRVWVRSPLRCETYSSVCQLCYGWSLAHGKLVNLGEAIGVIAAQSIGEPGTQLTMRTFHTGGVGVFSENAVESIYAPFSGVIRFVQELPGRFVRTPHGKIAYFLQYQETGADTCLFELDRETQMPNLLAKSFNPSVRESQKKTWIGDKAQGKAHKTDFTSFEAENSLNSYYVTESVLPPRSILCVKHGQYVQEGELLGQRFQTQSSTHVPIDYPVYALSPGEIRFEKLRISMKHEVHVKGRWGVGKIRRLIPPSRRLRGLGNFWVLNGHVFHYTGIGDPFFSCGDLVSINTPASQCMLHSPRRGYIQVLGSQPVLTLAQFGFGARSVRFHTIGYSFVSDHGDIFLYHGVFSDRLRLSWYPAQKTEYYFLSSFYSRNTFRLSQPISVIREKHLAWIRVYRVFREQLKRVEEGLKDFTKRTLEIPPKKELKGLYNTGRSLSTSAPGRSLRSSIPGRKSALSSLMPGRSLSSPMPGNSIVSQTENIAHVQASKLTSLSEVLFKNEDNQNNVRRYHDRGKKQSVFLRLTLDSVHQASIQRQSTKTSVAQQKLGWVYIPSLQCTDIHDGEINFEMRSDVQQPGLVVLENEKIGFPNQLISFEFLTNRTLSLASEMTGSPLERSSVSNWSLESKIAGYALYVSAGTHAHEIVAEKYSQEISRWLGKSETMVESLDSLQTKPPFNTTPSEFGVLLSKKISKTPRLLVSITRNMSETTVFLRQEKKNENIGGAKPQARNLNGPNYSVRIPAFLISRGILSTTLCLVSRVQEIQTPTASIIYREWSKRVKSEFSPVHELHTHRGPADPSRTTLVDRAVTTRTTNAQITNPLFTKQYPTRSKSGTRFAFSRHYLCSEGWNIANQTARITLYLSGPVEKDKKTSSHPQIYTRCINSNHVGDITSRPPTPGFHSLIYKPLSFEPISQFPIYVFPGHSIMPEIPIARVSTLINEQGEFLRYTRQSNRFVMSILPETSICAFTKPKISVSWSSPSDCPPPGRESALSSLMPGQSLSSPMPVSSQQLGQLVRYGEETHVIDNGAENESAEDRLEVAFPVNGQIIEISQNSIILRTGVSYLGSSRGLIYVNNNDIVEANQLLLVLKSQQLQTEDIVQGIPKIEQLFEARETQAGKTIRDTVHRRLEGLFVQRFLPFIQLQKCAHSRDASLKACEIMEEILPQGQLFLVEKIIEAYANQGVHISEKHVEIVVREMTHRGKIYEGSGSGLLPGEIVPLCSIRRFNAEQRQSTHPRYILYHPVVLGITKSVLHSESFLLAASFQEVSRVLVRSALSGKTDFLKGLHENVIVSRPISSGTGLLRL